MEATTNNCIRVGCLRNTPEVRLIPEPYTRIPCAPDCPTIVKKMKKNRENIPVGWQVE